MTNTHPLLKASLFDLIEAYNENKETIHIYLRRQAGQTVENYNEKAPTAIMGVSVAIFVVFLLIALGLFIWAIVVLVKFGSMMPTWALVVSIVLMILFPMGGSIVAIILGYVTRKPGAQAKFGFRFY